MHTTNYNVILCNRHTRRRYWNDLIAQRRAALTHAQKRTYIGYHKIEISEGDVLPFDDACPVDEKDLRDLIDDNDGGSPDGVRSTLATSSSSP